MAASDRQTRALARRLLALEKKGVLAKQPQLAYSSIEDGAIQSVEDDELRGIFGRQYDGTNTINIVNGPVPPVPSAPTGTPVLEGVKIRWDGTFVGDAVVPLDFARVELHASTDPGFTAEFAVTLVATFETPRGGEVFVGLAPGTWYFKLVTRTQSGNKSAASAAGTASPIPLSAAIPTATDGNVPPKVTGLGTNGGIRSIFLSWTPVTNPDATTYKVYGGTASGFTLDANHQIGSLNPSPRATVYKVWDDATSALVDLVAGTTYYFKVVAHDGDGDGVASDEVSASPAQVTGPDIAANTIIGDHILGNTITADKFDAILAMVSTLLVGENITIRPADSSPGANDNGIRIELDNGGHVYLPTDGTDVDLNRVKARFTEAVIEDELSILGVNNRVGGQLTLDASVPPPADAPTATSVFDQAPLALTGGTFTSCYGMGDNGTYWQVAQLTSWNSATGVATVQIHNLDKTTGARSTAYSFTFKPYGESLNYSQYSPAPPTPSLVGMSSTSGVAAVMFYNSTWNWTFNDGFHSPVSGSTAAGYSVVTVNNTTGAVNTNWGPSVFPLSSYNQASVFTDGTYVYVGTTSKSDQKARVGRYGLNASGGTTLMTSSAALGNINLTGLFIGSADFGSSRYVFQAGTSHYVYNGATRDTANEWLAADAARGLAWDGTRFKSFHSAGNIKKYSTIISAPSRVAKYTWFRTGVGTESTASPTATVTQGVRQWLKVTTAAIPTSSDSGSPNAVRIYVANQRQTDLSAGVTTVVYEAPTTGGSASPGSDGFAALGITGAVISEAEESAGVPAIQLKGSGKYRLGDQVDGPWIKYTPAFVGAGTSIGNATHECRYKYIADKTILVEGKITFGSTTTMGTAVAVEVSLPVTPYLNGTGLQMDYVGSCILLDSSAGTPGYRTGSSFLFDTNGVAFLIHETTTGKFAGNGVPWAWASGDILRWSIIYEVA